MTEDRVNRRAVIGGAAALAIAGNAGVATAQGPAISALGRRDGRWLNAPKAWKTAPGGDLTLVTDKGSDFWRETHYGFTRDSGHFLGFAAPAAFTAQLRIRGQY